MSEAAAKAYSRRSAEYVERFGSMASVHPSDRQLVDTWADQAAGPFLDAGCGPGHWTGHLVGRGMVASGVDLSADLVASARARHPGVRFDVGDIDALDAPSESLGGVLAWYSLIHHRPSDIRRPLTEFARVLRPGGDLLLGFFEGAAVEAFDHAIHRAYRWPICQMQRELDAAGFDVVETHTRTGASERPRPHGAIVARRRSARTEREGVDQPD